VSFSLWKRDFFGRTTCGRRSSYDMPMVVVILIEFGRVLEWFDLSPAIVQRIRCGSRGCLC
jgi:hypothetical protein